MCESKPGPRCGSDTAAAAQQTLEDYIRAWPGRTEVNVAAAVQAVLDHDAALAQDAGLRVDNSPEPDDLDGPHVARRGHAAQLALVRSGETPEPDDVNEMPAPRPEPLFTFGDVDDDHGPWACDETTWNEPTPGSTVVKVDGREFRKRMPGVYGDWPDGIRIETGRRLTNAEMRRLGGIVAYAQRSCLRGAEGMSGPFRDGPNSFVMYQDATKTWSDDYGIALSRFEDTLPDMLTEGTPKRRTSRTGPIGSRLIDGVDDLGDLSLWYSDTFDVR